MCGDDRGRFDIQRIGREHEIRFAQEPFVLYPGEKLVGEVTPLTVVPANTALRLRATRDHDREGSMVRLETRRPAIK